MSNVRPDIDLAGLSRAPKAATIEPPRRGPWRLWLPILILVAFLAVLFTSLADMFRTATEVTVVRPRPIASGAGATQAGSARVVLQAAGWIEPDPFPIQVTALTAGVVREVLVLEAESVKKDQVIARLIDADAALAVQESEAALAESEASREEAAARARIAEQSFALALAVTEAEAVALAELEGRKAEKARREAAVKSGDANYEAARDELALQRELLTLGAVEARVVDLAEARVAEADGARQGLRAEADLAAADLARAQAAHARARRELDTRLAERLEVEASAAALRSAEARVASARSKLELARLALARTEIRAPADGIVLERLSMPGSTVDPAGAATICTLFDPARLRVRVDVPQADVFQLQVGGRAEILIEGRAGRPYQGEVVRLVQKADIQKVTLQVHVRIEDGDERLRPEMLAQARFLAGAGAGAGAEPGTASAGSTAVEIPAALVDAGGSVWIVDGVERNARLRKVELGRRAGDWVEVLSGLDLSDKVIDRGRETLKEGAAVRILDDVKERGR